MLAVMVLSSIKFCHSKLSDLMLCLLPKVWGILLAHDLQRHHTYNSVKEQDPICAYMNGNTQHQSAGNELDPSCLWQAHSNRPGTGPGYKSTEPGCLLTVLHLPSIIYVLRNVDAKPSKIV